MAVATFDTHAAVTALRKAGFEERQAEAAVALVRDAVTKADIDRLEAKMEAGFAPLKWVVGIVAALTIAIAARQFGAI